MTNRYPLHHTDAQHLYRQVTEDDYRRLKAENEELKEKTRWRKVSDDKPELGDIILVKLSERVNGHYFPMDVVRWDSSCELGEIEVSHWMPLPEPPEEPKEGPPSA